MVVDVGGPVSVHVGAAASLRVVVPRVHLVHLKHSFIIKRCHNSLLSKKKWYQG